jgi:hypothetical protein
VVFHDSFGEALIPFIAEGFQRTVFAPEDVLDCQLVEREKPDVVIHEMVERKLGLPAPLDPGLGPVDNLPIRQQPPSTK